MVFPRGSREPTRAPGDADLSIDPYGTAERGAGHKDRDVEANTDGGPSGRVSGQAGVDCPPRSGAVPAPDAQPNGDAGLVPYANARGRVNRGGITRL